MKILTQYKKNFNKTKEETMTLESYLKKLKTDKSLYSSPYERLLKAIGKPELVNTSSDSKLSRIFGNRTIKIYKTFSEFYGMEDTIGRIVSFLTHASQGLEESKQILYLLGPVGSAKSSLAERLKELMEENPIYILKHNNDRSPLNESPLSLFDVSQAKELGVPARILGFKLSPWARKRLNNDDGDLSNFSVSKVYPSQLDQLAISKTEPGDENNQDISSLVGKINIRMLEHFDQDDPDAYGFTGGLELGNRGIMEFVEMFKAPIKMLHPLLTATQESNYIGTEQIGSIPFDGIILAHSNQTEWEAFKNDSKNEAFIDRVYIVKVPYNLRVDEEQRIYTKLLAGSELKDFPCAPGTLQMLSEFAVSSRLVVPENSNIYSKMKVYNGESVKNKDPKAKSLQEYKDSSGVMEGMSGISTRFCFKVLSQVFNFDNTEIAANPVHLMYILETTIKQEQFEESQEQALLTFIKEYLAANYAKTLENHFQTAYLESYAEYGQAIFDRYILHADHWIQENDYRDPDTGQLYDRNHLAKELTIIETAAKISNAKDFRHEVVNYSLRYKATHGGVNPSWTSYAKLKRVIETFMFDKTEDLLPVISFNGGGNSGDKKKHTDFLARMKDMGYTPKQVRLLYEWFVRFKSNS